MCGEIVKECDMVKVVKDGEEIGATILYPQRTPTEIRRQTKQEAHHQVGLDETRAA